MLTELHQQAAMLQDLQREIHDDNQLMEARLNELPTKLDNITSSLARVVTTDDADSRRILGACVILLTHTHAHTQPFTALWILSGTTRVSRYQKKHSPTRTYRGHQSSLICFIHVIRFVASSLFNPRAWQSSSTISLISCHFVKWVLYMTTETVSSMLELLLLLFHTNVNSNTWRKNPRLVTAQCSPYPQLVTNGSLVLSPHPVTLFWL